MRHILVITAILIATAGSTAAQENGLTAEKMIICTDIEERLPVGESTQFFESVERLYCYTRIAGAIDTLQVTHVWFFGEEEKARVPLTIKSASWRTWSSKKMLDAWSGAWRVDVLGPDGKVLLSREFVYKPVDE